MVYKNLLQSTGRPAPVLQNGISKKNFLPTCLTSTKSQSNLNISFCWTWFRPVLSLKKRFSISHHGCKGPIFLRRKLFEAKPCVRRNDPDITCVFREKNATFFLWTHKYSIRYTKPIGHAVHQVKMSLMSFAGHRFIYNYGSGIMWISPRFRESPSCRSVWDSFLGCFFFLGMNTKQGELCFFVGQFSNIFFWSEWKFCASWSNKSKNLEPGWARRRRWFSYDAFVEKSHEYVGLVKWS